MKNHTNLLDLHNDLLINLVHAIKHQNPDKSYILIRASLEEEGLEHRFVWFDEIDPEFFEGRSQLPELPEDRQTYFQELIRQASIHLKCPLDRLGVNIVVDHKTKYIALGLVDKKQILDRNPVFVI